ISVFGQLCSLPPIYRKTLYSIENGKETTTQIKATEISQDIDKLNGTCFQILQTTTVEANKTDSVHPIFQGRNVSEICNLISGIELETGFINSREQYSDFNCKSIIEGIYSFEYRIVGSTGVCRSPNSILKACQRQGSPLRDNSVYEQTFGFCPNFFEVSVLEEPNIVYGKANIWRCYARWVADDGTVWAAVEYDTNMPKFKYRCLATSIDQQNRRDIIQWGGLNAIMDVQLPSTLN
ncbi:hypothetical protein TSMEX_006671, partial [Taenia solium]